MFSNKLKGLYCIIGESNFLHDSFDQTIKVCLENKIKLFQIRFKNESIFFEHELKLKSLIEKIHNHSGLVLVNDHITHIEEFNFDGIHLGQSDISPISAKHIYKKKIIGLSCYNSISLANQYLDYIDYVSFGAMHRSSTKKNAREISQAELQKIIKFKSKPKAIIGGINLDTYESNISNNFDMIAISDGIFSSEDLPSFLNMLNKS
tara:strand:- start:1528 stop:2145 length:618 start_codon:yes stop_codon:yes gene_type:complete